MASASPQYYEKAAEAYIEYDLEKANKLLDAAGYAKKDADGIRLYKDGSPISFTIEGINSAGTDVDAAGLVSQDLAAVGIKAAYKSVERALYTEHYNANELQAAFWGGDRTVLPLVPEAIIFRGVQPDRPWCVAWGFATSQQRRDRPQRESSRRMATASTRSGRLWDEEIAIEVDPGKQNALFKQILDIWAEEVPMIGLLGECPRSTIVKNGFKGSSCRLPNDDTTGDENLSNTETYSWDDPVDPPSESIRSPP